MFDFSDDSNYLWTEIRTFVGILAVSIESETPQPMSFS